jgi:hypothetical protein
MLQYRKNLQPVDSVPSPACGRGAGLRGYLPQVATLQPRTIMLRYKKNL